MRGRVVAAALALALAGAGPVLAEDDDCNVPMADWQPRESVQKLADAQGWVVRRIRIDDGCYEVQGTDRAGQEFRAKIDPGSLVILRIRSRGHDSGLQGPGPWGPAQPDSAAGPGDFNSNSNSEARS